MNSSLFYQGFTKSGIAIKIEGIDRVDFNEIDLTIFSDSGDMWLMKGLSKSKLYLYLIGVRDFLELIQVPRKNLKIDQAEFIDDTYTRLAGIHYHSGDDRLRIVIGTYVDDIHESEYSSSIRYLDEIIHFLKTKLPRQL